MKGFESYHRDVLEALKESDSELYQLLQREYKRQQNTIQLVASESQCSKAVLAALGSVVQNKTAEGFPGARHHAGSAVIDDIETVAIQRAKDAFNAQYVNVQPHSGAGANHIVFAAVLDKGDKILSLALEQGGHYSHGTEGSFAGKFLNVENYSLNKTTFLLDYDAIAKLAAQVKPRLIICGFSVYPRAIDFARFRAIADAAGAYLLADISHIFALVLAGAHQSPVNYAHFTTTSTYKAGGPRGGVILMGKDYDRSVTVGKENMALWQCVQRATFPGMQGTAQFNNIAAKAVFFKEVLSEQYKARQFKVIENAKTLAGHFLDMGYDVLTGGTDNHMFVINAADFRDGLTGLTAEKCLEDCGIIVNMVRVPYENEKGPGSGIRIGTPVVTKMGMGAEEMRVIAQLTDRALRSVHIVSGTEYDIADSVKNDIRQQAENLCSRFCMT